MHERTCLDLAKCLGLISWLPASELSEAAVLLC